MWDLRASDTSFIIWDSCIGGYGHWWRDRPTSLYSYLQCLLTNPLIHQWCVLKPIYEEYAIWDIIPTDFGYLSLAFCYISYSVKILILGPKWVRWTFYLRIFLKQSKLPMKNKARYIPITYPDFRIPVRKHNWTPTVDNPSPSSDESMGKNTERADKQKGNKKLGTFSSHTFGFQICFQNWLIHSLKLWCKLLP